jgi:phosphoglycerate-specific signal transduction histidine kinase
VAKVQKAQVATQKAKLSVKKAQLAEAEAGIEDDGSTPDLKKLKEEIGKQKQKIDKTTKQAQMIREYILNQVLNHFDEMDY